MSWKRLPRWRGFNLLEKFTLARNAPYVERDFEWMARWGFDFARLPLDYRTWTPADRRGARDESVLREIDRAVEWGKQYGVHISLNLHRAPGYCVNPPEEPLDLWTSDWAQEAFASEWRGFSRRYRGVPSARLSFDLLNEPRDMEESAYARVMRFAASAVREEDPQRLVIVDGLRWGRDPVPSLIDLEVAESTRGYDPMRVSHHRASWVRGSDRWPEPTWPLAGGDSVRDRESYRARRIEPWKALAARGPAVHVGEWGAFRETPHAVVLRWMQDLLGLWRECGWGWALWNLRGGFGVADSGRRDVRYEAFGAHLLDRKMLELLLADGRK